MNFEFSASRWMEATHIYARVSIHTHTHTYTHTHTHTYTQTHIHTYTHIHTHIYTHTHARAHIQKHDFKLHRLVSSISSDGVVYHHSDVSPDGATAPVDVTLWNDCIAMSKICFKRESFISFGNINCLSTNFVGVRTEYSWKERSVAWDHNWKNGWIATQW